MFRTGWITTWWWPTHRRAGHGGGAEAFDGADREGGSAFGVGVEVVGVDEDVEPDLPGALLGDAGAEDGVDVAGGLSGGEGGDQGDGFDLADAEGVGVAVEPELVGDGAEQVVEPWRTRVSPVAARSVVPV